MIRPIASCPAGSALYGKCTSVLGSIPRCVEISDRQYPVKEYTAGILLRARLP